MLKRNLAAAGVAAIACAAALTPAATAELVLPRVSPKATVSQTIGLTDMTLTYSRPGVKGRDIWGALVPHDKPWRTGANEATTFTTSDEITVAGQKLSAGTYSFFTIPSAGEWSVIFSRQKELWGAFDYDPSQDQLRVTAKPTTGEHVEWMRLGFEDLSVNSANLVLRWEKMQLTVPIEVAVNDKVLASCRTEVTAAKADDWRTPMRAAGWCFDQTLNLDEAAGWLDKSMAVQQTYQNLSLKARWMMKDGKKKDALTTAKKAVEMGKASKEKVDTSGTEKLIADWTAAK